MSSDRLKSFFHDFSNYKNKTNPKLKVSLINNNFRNRFYLSIRIVSKFLPTNRHLTKLNRMNNINKKDKKCIYTTDQMYKCCDFTII